MLSFSIVIPCLNEEDTLGICLRKIRKIFNRNKKYKAEIIVVDNGSSDSSIKIAKSFNVRVI